MHLAHMINHLILARKPTLPPPMTARELARHALQGLRVVHDLDVALEIGVAGEMAGGGALGVEADEVLAVWSVRLFGVSLGARVGWLGEGTYGRGAGSGE